MKNRLVFFLKYYIFWILYFILLKVLFLLFHFSKTNTLNFHEITGVFIHGFKLDLSSSSYIAASSLVLIVLLSFFKTAIFKKVMRYISIFAIVLCSFIAIADLELYKYWGYRLDTTPLIYIDTPGEMLASIEWFAIVKLIAILSLLIWFSIKLYEKFVETEIVTFKKMKLWQLPVFLFIACCMIIPIRGGINLAPLNTGTAYFSDKIFANHAANNVVWNLAFSITYYGESSKNPFIWTDQKNAVAIRDGVVGIHGITKNVIKTNRPNIILIILESFNNKMIEALGGMLDVTPNINAYCKEGICFTNFYSSGDRSDKGLVAIHSAFPAQPIASIIKFPTKTEMLPFFTKDLKKAGYYCSYYYGGDINFASMSSYIKNAGYNEIVSDIDFPKSTYGAKWGVHDEFVFDRFYHDLLKSRSPYFKALFTLSSHEPFDVPYKSNFSGSSEEQKYLNASRYTDSCLGFFVEKLKKTTLWDSTLLIITADHGSNHPNNSDYYECIRYKIPMIWLGGILKENGIIVNRIGAQTDIAPTLLNQLSIKAQKEFPYGKDLLDNSNSSFAYYSFNNGFGFVNDTAKVVYNNASGTTMFREGKVNDDFLNIGKSIQQVVYSDFLIR